MDDRASSVASADVDQEKTQMRKGPWTVEEDMVLTRFISVHGEGRWSFLARAAGLKRTGKSCRLRWVNYLRPDLKRSKITPEEERLIIELHGRLGRRWSRIAQSLPGRTDNEIKNYWRTRLKRKMNPRTESGNNGMDAGNQLHFLRSRVSSGLTLLSRRQSNLDKAQPSTSSPTQNTQDMEVQANKTTNLQEDISSQAISVGARNYEYGLQGEIHSPQINNDGQPGEALQELLEGSDELFGNKSPYNFPMAFLATDLLSCEFFLDGASQDGKIPPSSYIIASQEVFSHSESQLNCYWDVLWNMDEEDNRFIRSQHSGSQDGSKEY